MQNIEDETKSVLTASDDQKSASAIPMNNEGIAEHPLATLSRINEEFKQGFEFIKKYEKSVTFFGSSRFDTANDYSEDDAYNIARKIVLELGYAIITGGGPGVMEAANKGAFEAGGDSLGLTIDLPREQLPNPYVTDHLPFHYFFTRKTILTYAAEAYIFFPGGFGTLDEFFDTLTLIQTRKIPAVPIILFNKSFWTPLHDFIMVEIGKRNSFIDKFDTQLYKITDDHDEIINMIKKAPVMRWWKDF